MLWQLRPVLARAQQEARPTVVKTVAAPQPTGWNAMLSAPRRFVHPVTILLSPRLLERQGRPGKQRGKADAGIGLGRACARFA